MKYLGLGTITEGTTKSDDILDALADALENALITNINAGHMNGLQCRDQFKLVFDAREALDALAIQPDSTACWQDVDDLLDPLREALEDFAPPLCYVGNHEGDGADFGVWVSWDSIDHDSYDSDLVKVDSLPSYVLVVNDHGNASLHLVETKAVWSVV